MPYGRLASTGLGLGTIGVAGYVAPVYALAAAAAVVVGLLVVRLARKLGQD